MYMNMNMSMYVGCVCMNVCVRARCVVASAGMNALNYTVPLCMMHVLLYRLGRAHYFEITKVHFCRIFAGDLSYGGVRAAGGRRTATAGVRRSDILLKILKVNCQIGLRSLKLLCFWLSLRSLKFEIGISSNLGTMASTKKTMWSPSRACMCMSRVNCFAIVFRRSQN